MRIDREAFLAALAALGGCQQDRSQLQPPAMAHVQTAAVATREVPRVAQPLPLPVVHPIELPPPVPHPPAPHQRQTPKRWFHDLPRKQRDSVTAFCETRAE